MQNQIHDLFDTRKCLFKTHEKAVKAVKKIDDFLISTYVLDILKMIEVFKKIKINNSNISSRKISK
jgi:hypothetical protein